MTDTAPRRPRSSRVWLYAPFIALVLAAAAWTGFWFIIRGRVIDAVDTALAKEAGLGRSWDCTDRSVSGFPFRVELRCGALSLSSARWGETVRVQTGPALAVGQIYTPNLVIAQIASKQYEVPRVIVRVMDPARAEWYAEQGLHTICPTRYAIEMFEEALEA